MTLEVKEDPAMLQPSLEPLSSMTRVLLQTDAVPPKVVESLIRLQKMEDASLGVHDAEDEETTLSGLGEESFHLENNFNASITKFADLRGMDKEEVVCWRKSGKAGKSSGSLKIRGQRGHDPDYVNMVKEDIQEAGKVGEHSLNVNNKKKIIEMSDLTRLSAKDGEVELESRSEYLQDIYRLHWSTERSNIWAPRPTGDKFLRLEKCNYWFHHPGDFHMGTFDRTYARPSNGFKQTADFKDLKAGGRDSGLAERIFGSLPAHYSWTVNYLASYALLEPLELHREVAELERLLLLLDPNFFGMRRVVKLEDPQAQEKKEVNARNHAKRKEKMARQEEEAAREEVAKAAASRLKRRQRFLEMSPRDQGWWSLSKVKAGEKCGVCEACWTTGEENGEEQEVRQCLGLTYKPTAPTRHIMCMKCEHCTAKVCGTCSICKGSKDGENNQGENEREINCIWRRHCARNCGVCAACKDKEEFGGEATGESRSCLVKGKLVVDQEIKVVEEDAVFEHLAEYVQDVGAPNARRVSGSKQPSSLKEIKEELASQLDATNRGKILIKYDDGDVEDVWKKLAMMTWMMETTSFATEKVYMKAQYLCTICQKKSDEVLMFSQGSEGETVCTVQASKDLLKGAVKNKSIRVMRKAHLRHMVSHTGKGIKGTLPGFGNDENAGGEKVSIKSTSNKQKEEQEGKRRQECDLCDFSSSSKGEMSRHRDDVHFPEEKICPFCDKPFKSRFFRDCHVKKVHRVSPPRSMARSLKLHKSKHKSKDRGWP